MGNYGVKEYQNSAEYRVPIGLQFIFGLVLGVGLFFLPDSPRYYVKRGRVEKARKALSSVRGQPQDSEYVEAELAEIIANEEYERSLIPAGSWINGWMNCFRGSVFKSNSNLRKTILGTSLQMMQQWTGVNFIFYYSTPFLQSTGAISDPFLTSMIFTIVNVCSTPISFYTVEKFGRRPLLIWGAFGMMICQFLVAIIGVTVGFNHTYENAAGETIANNIPAVNAQIAFIAIFIFFFASTWGPGAWIVIGEIFPLPIRSRGVGLSTASNWLWNTIIAVITPYMVSSDEGDEGNLGVDSRNVVGNGLTSSVFVGVVEGNSDTDDSNEELADQHAESTPDQERATTKPLDSPEGDRGGADVDQGEDQRDQEDVVNSAGRRQEWRRVVEDEVHTSPLLHHLKRGSEDSLAKVGVGLEDRAAEAVHPAIGPAASRDERTLVLLVGNNLGKFSFDVLRILRLTTDAGESLARLLDPATLDVVSR